jgi:hypothetical protein
LFRDGQTGADVVTKVLAVVPQAKLDAVLVGGNLAGDWRVLREHGKPELFNSDKLESGQYKIVPTFLHQGFVSQ